MNLPLVVGSMGAGSLREQNRQTVELMLHPRMPPMLRTLPQLDDVALSSAGESKEEGITRRALDLTDAEEQTKIREEGNKMGTVPPHNHTAPSPVKEAVNVGASETPLSIPKNLPKDPTENGVLIAESSDISLQPIYPLKTISEDHTILPIRQQSNTTAIVTPASAAGRLAGSAGTEQLSVLREDAMVVDDDDDDDIVMPTINMHSDSDSDS